MTSPWANPPHNPPTPAPKSGTWYLEVSSVEYDRVVTYAHSVFDLFERLHTEHPAIPAPLPRSEVIKVIKVNNEVPLRYARYVNNTGHFAETPLTKIFPSIENVKERVNDCGRWMCLFTHLFTPEPYQ